jgi:predicted dehydrogenase
MRAAAEGAGKTVGVGFKKMFAPVNRKVRELMSLAEFGRPSLGIIQYPQRIPTAQQFEAYLKRREPVAAVTGFLDHICHPASLMIYLFGYPETLYYERSATGAGAATFRFASGAVVSILLTAGQATTGGMEHTTIVSDAGKHIVADNNVRLYHHRTPPAPKGRGYGSTPDFFTGEPGEASAYWEPEFSLGQLYNKGLFLLGYYDEVNEFARSILEGHPLERGTLEQAAQVTRIFEAFAEGPSKTISLG